MRLGTKTEAKVMIKESGLQDERRWGVCFFFFSLFSFVGFVEWRWIDSNIEAANGRMNKGRKKEKERKRKKRDHPIRTP